MNLKKFAIALAGVLLVGGSGAFARGINYIGNGVYNYGMYNGFGYNRVYNYNNLGWNNGYNVLSQGAVLDGNVLNQGVVLDQGAVLNGSSCGSNVVLSQPEVIAAPTCHRHHRWFDLSFFGHGIHLGGRSKCETGCLPLSQAAVVDNSCAAPQVIQQPAVCEPQTQMLKDTITTTTTTRYRVIARPMHRVIKHKKVVCHPKRCG